MILRREFRDLARHLAKCVYPEELLSIPEGKRTDFCTSIFHLAILAFEKENSALADFSESLEEEKIDELEDTFPRED